MALTITPNTGTALVFSSANVQLRQKQGLQAVRGAPSHPTLTLTMTRFVRGRLAELEAIAAPVVEQQKNRAGVYQVVSTSPAQLCVFDWSELDRRSNTTVARTYCGVFQIADASLEGLGESLSLVLYKANRLSTPGYVQTRGL
jgi:hypothetical protein